ncbi:hypothetical protein LSPH26S_05013 [Lysinibacillus sphaericus]
MKKNVKPQSFITIGMLSSISFLLMLFNFPIPPFPYLWKWISVICLPYLQPSRMA